MKNEVKLFQGHEVEVLELNEEVLFNPYHVGACLELSGSAIKMAISRMNNKQVIKITNSKVNSSDFRKLNNTGENFLTESGVYKLVFKSRKPNAEEFTDWIADEVLPSLRKTGSYTVKKEPSKKKNLSSVNMAAKMLKETLSDAGCDKKYIAVEIVNLYKNEAGIELKVPLISDVPKLYDCTTMAKELGLISESGNLHEKAISAIIQKVGIVEDEMIVTPYTKNGHSDVMVQYKEPVLQRVKNWLIENDQPSKIPHTLSNGKAINYKVFYENVEVA